ncbi:MAG: acyltransferase family protein [Bacteroidetes bacterium]|nr:acyltransferase family protein [Bacteroidota bacterium]
MLKAHQNGVLLFAGKLTWHSLAYSIWEQVTGISIMVALMGIFKTKWNSQSNFAGKLSGSAFAVYVLHPPILVLISILFIDWEVMLLIKFLVLTPIAIIASFAVALLVKRVPILKKVF